MEEKKLPLILKIFFILIILIVVIVLYARYINPYSFKVKEVAVTLDTLNSDYNGFKIVQFSDIHYDRTVNIDKLKKIVKEINKLNPDIVVFTGDLLDNKNLSEKDRNNIIKYFKKINCKLFKFAVIGDYDKKYLNIYKDILEESNFTLLDNTSKLVYYNSKEPLNFIGITNLNNLEELYSNDYFNITLTHKPDNIKKLSNTPLVIAGHSLGGQFKIPFIGGIKKIKGANTYIDDYYQVNNTKLYISNGLGTQDISMRIFNTPSITLYRLYNY